MRSSTSWLAHLRAGGTTPWAAYEGDERAADRTDPAASDGITGPGRTVLVGAQQLEVLRRLNGLGRVSPALAERVLHADLVGRGHGLLRLAGDGEAHRFGTPPVDPATLTRHELMRVVVGLLAQDVVRIGVPELAPQRRPRLRRVRYRLTGDPWLAVPAREDLIRRGYPQGGGRTITFLVGRDLPTMLADTWSWRSLTNGAPAWDVWLRKIQRAGALPASADLARQARWWAQRVGGHNIRIVTDPSLLPSILRVDHLAQPPMLSANAVELARQVAPVVSLFAGDDRSELILRGLAPQLARTPGPALAVPDQAWAWVQDQARRAHAELTGGHYAVLGDPDLILGLPAGPPTDPRADPRARAAGSDGVPSESAVLTLALRTLLENDHDSRAGSRVEGV